MNLSIIICVYNTSRELLEGCLMSLKNSTLFTTSSPYATEIIMVDDGSDIDYSDLVNDHGLKYTRTENRGIFHARSLGVSLASGEYIVFMDSDDTVSFNYHLPMLEKAEDEEADIVINDWAYHTDSSRYYTNADSTITTENMRLTNDEAIEAFLSQQGREHSYYVLWNKLYRRKILTEAIKRVEKDVEKIERYNYSEDVLINFYAFLVAKLVVNLHTGYYFYRIHAFQSVNASSEESLRSQILLMSFTLSKMETAIDSHPCRNKLKGHISEWRGFISRSHFTHAKNGRFKSLYPYIKKKYSVSKLSKSTYRDEICGMRCIPLPENFTEIDTAFLSLWNIGISPTLPKKTIGYMRRTVDYFISHGFKASSTAPTLPAPRVSFKKRLLFHPILMRIARVFFPKGSRIRSFLKKRM